MPLHHLAPLLALVLVACASGPSPGDTDGDGRPNEQDNCPSVVNAAQADGDGDGIGDACDNCSAKANTDQADGDRDLVGDACDNCLTAINTEQADTDGDGIGDFCDNCRAVAGASQADADTDGVGDLCDNCPRVKNTDQRDSDNSGFGDVCEPGCRGAKAMAVGSAVDSALVTPAADKHYFKFEAQAGELFVIAAFGKPDSDPYGDTYPDLVVTLFDATGAKQLARNDDPETGGSNNPALYTRIPADGTYCVEVAECNAVLGADRCSDPALITERGYSVVVDAIPPGENYLAEAEPNDSGAQATSMPFTPADPGTYVAFFTGGTFSAVTDADLFTFTVPADLSATGSRPVFNLDLLSGGVESNGSTADRIQGTLALASAPAAILARAELSGGQGLAAPVTRGETYLLRLARTGGSVGANDFYLLETAISRGNPLEAEPNDTLEAAQALPATAGASFVEGDLPAGDVDLFSVSVPPNQRKISVVCAAQAQGSGVRSLVAALQTVSGEALGAPATETAEEPAFISAAEVPPGANRLVVKVSAGTPAADVGSRHYRCGIRFAP